MNASLSRVFFGAVLEVVPPNSAEFVTELIMPCLPFCPLA